MPLVKFVYPAILTLVVGALLSAVVLRTGDPTALNPKLPQGSLKSGEEAPAATRDQQATGGGLVIASAAGNSASSAHPLPSSLPELRSPVGPSSSPELLSSDRTIELDGTAEFRLYHRTRRNCPVPLRQGTRPSCPVQLHHLAHLNHPVLLKDQTYPICLVLLTGTIYPVLLND